MAKIVQKLPQTYLTNLKQLVVHDHIVATINKQADRVFNATNLTEQALALQVIDAYVKAFELINKVN